MDKNNEQAACNGDQHEDPVDNMDEEAAAKEKLTNDPNQVKFTSVNLDGCDGKNGEAKVDIQLSQVTVGMGKDELMKYANEPFWVKLRMFLFVFFWIAWIAMLVGAIVIIIMAPRCPPAPHLDWYQKTSMYEIDVESFKDSNNDGVGDFAGLTSKLDYFKNQNIGTLILNAFYKLLEGSVVDHREIDERLGTLSDFEDFMAEIKKRELKVIIDFNPYYSSEDHQWFQNSVQGVAPYVDSYIWANASNGGPPNDWKAVNNDPAWNWNSDRRMYYLATYGKDKPDYNLRNPFVKAELKDTLRFWLDKDVHGFRILAAPHLFEEHPIGVKNMTEYKDDKYSINQDEFISLFKDWKEILNNVTTSSGSKKILLADVPKSLSTTVVTAGNQTSPLADLHISTLLTKLSSKSTGIEFENLLKMLPEDSWPALLLGSRKTQRLASRVGDMLDGIHMATFLAKGTPITYYGDELGLPDIPGQENSGPQIMPWDGDASAGFTNGTILNNLNLHPDFDKINVKVQETEKQSHLNIYKKLLALRGQPALSFGEQKYPLVTNEIFSMIRVRKGAPGYLVVFNMGNNSTTIDFTKKSEYLPEMAHVEIRSHNVIDGLLAEGDRPKIPLNNIVLEAKQSVVFTFVPLFDG